MTAVGARLVAVARASDIPYLEGRAVSVGGTRIAIFRTASGFRAIDAACPHRGGPLADGLVGDDCVTCPLHNRRIDLTSGEVVAGGTGAVAVHQVRERDGWLYLEVDR